MPIPEDFDKNFRNDREAAQLLLDALQDADWSQPTDDNE